MNLIDQISKQLDGGKVAEYSEVSKQLDELREKYASEVPDASTKAGYDRAKEIVREIMSLRVAIEARRKERKAPVLALGKYIDGEAKRITEILSGIETPFKIAYQEVDKAKAKRKAEIDDRINQIKGLTSLAAQSNSETIETMINELAEMDVSKDTFGNREKEAIELVAFTLENLSGMHAKAISDEEEQLKIEAERAELAALRKMVSTEKPQLRTEEITAVIETDNDLKSLELFFTTDQIDAVTNSGEYPVKIILRRI